MAEHRVRRALEDLAALDRALYRAIAGTRTPALDEGMRRLSIAANHSKISLTIAGVLAICGPGPRRAAMTGVAAVATASACANLLGKTVARRARPNRDTGGVPAARRVPMPASASFPSGHSATAFAFAVAVGSQAPVTAVPLGMLAATVAYSRVHTGVHYPADVAAGALLGLASASAVVRARQSRLAG